MKTPNGSRNFLSRIIRNANRKEWEISRQGFMIGASCAADVLGVGRSSRNQILQRYVWKAFKQLTRKNGVSSPRCFINKREDRPVNEFLQRKMDNGSRNEARMMKVVRMHGLTLAVTQKTSESQRCSDGGESTTTCPSARCSSTAAGTTTEREEEPQEEMFVMTKEHGAPGTEIEEWTIVVSPFHDLMACSPDGLYLKGGLGYEFKTKDFVKVPQRPEEILDCEYLQCQTCLSFCRDFVWAWILCYNRLDTGEFKAYLVVLDEGLWDSMVQPELEEFVQRARDSAATLYGQYSGGATGGEERVIDFEQFFDTVKYVPFIKGVKQQRHDTLTASKRAHVFPIKFQ